MDTVINIVISYTLLTFIFIIVVTIWSLFVRRAMLKEFFRKLIEYFTLGAYPIEPVDDIIVEPAIDEREILFRKFEPFTEYEEQEEIWDDEPYDDSDFEVEMEEVFKWIGYSQYLIKLQFAMDSNGNVIRMRGGKETPQILFEEW